MPASAIRDIVTDPSPFLATSAAAVSRIASRTACACASTVSSKRREDPTNPVVVLTKGQRTGDQVPIEQGLNVTVIATRNQSLTMRRGHPSPTVS